MLMVDRKHQSRKVGVASCSLLFFFCSLFATVGTNFIISLPPNHAILSFLPPPPPAPAPPLFQPVKLSYFLLRSPSFTILLGTVDLHCIVLRVKF